MNVTQQHMLDAYRATLHDSPAPPAPGTREWQAVREFRTWRDFRAVVDERVAARRARWAALLSFLRPAAPAVRPSAARPSAVRPAAVRPSAGSPSAVRPHAVQQPADRLGDGSGSPVQCR
ncbi:hypothetical protein AB0K09_13470 [Streptomyces sp. NPDC049577]|uniref:hypothetical protein n=1 Tax=Streptomyces sp. NPDC049577 TaxID=3155153 RepID=UPI0034239A70